MFNIHFFLVNIYHLYECPGEGCIGNNTCGPHRLGPVCAKCEPNYYDWGNGCQGLSLKITLMLLCCINNGYFW